MLLLAESCGPRSEATAPVLAPPISPRFTSNRRRRSERQEWLAPGECEPRGRRLRLVEPTDHGTLWRSRFEHGEVLHLEGSAQALPTIAESQDPVWFAHRRVAKAYGVDLPITREMRPPHAIVVRAPKKHLAKIVEQLSGVLELVNGRHRVLDPSAAQTGTVADKLRWLLSNNGGVAPAGEREDKPPSSA